MAALSSYHNIWMMNQAASKSVVMLLTQGFLPSPCPVAPEGGTERREKGFVWPCFWSVMRSAIYFACYSIWYVLSVLSTCVGVFSHVVCVIPKVYSESWLTTSDVIWFYWSSEKKYAAFSFGCCIVGGNGCMHKVHTHKSVLKLCVQKFHSQIFLPEFVCVLQTNEPPQTVSTNNQSPAVSEM